MRNQQEITGAKGAKENFSLGRLEFRVLLCGAPPPPGGERRISAAKGKQSDTEALCPPPPPPGGGGNRHLVTVVVAVAVDFALVCSGVVGSVLPHYVALCCVGLQVLCFLRVWVMLEEIVLRCSLSHHHPSTGSARASLYIYNTFEEVDKFIEVLKSSLAMLRS